MNRYFSDRHFYNLAFLAAKPDEILATLRGLKGSGILIKAVVYGLELAAFFKQKIAVITKDNSVQDCTNLLSADDANHKFYDYKHYRITESSKVIDCGLGKTSAQNRML
jgi:hypothetical protein